LLRDVRLDDLVGDVPAAAVEVVACPDMTPPKPLPRVRKLGEQAIGAFPWHPLDQATDGDVGRDRHHDMDMVRRDMALEHVHPGLLACLADDGTDPFGDLAAPHLMAILGDPDDREMDGKGGVGAMAIVTYAPKSTENLLKRPPKGGGFAHLRALKHLN